MLFCFRYKKLLMPYAEGALGAEGMLRVERHVLRCPVCSAELAELQSVSSALRVADVPAVEPASDLWMKVQQAITEPVPVQRPWWQMKSYHIASAAAVAGVFLIAVLSMQLPMHDGLHRIPDSTLQSKVPATIKQDTSKRKTGQPGVPYAESPTKARTQERFPKKYPVRRSYSAPSLSTKITLEARGITRGDKSAPSTPYVSQTPNFEEQNRTSDFYYSKRDESKSTADIANKGEAVRSPFSQMGRAPGGSQNAAVIEKSQDRFYADKDGDNTAERIASSNKPMPSAAPAQPAPAVTENATTLGDSAAVAGKPLGKDKPLVVADAPGSVTGSMCNVWPPLTKGNKTATPANAEDSKTVAGYDRRATRAKEENLSKDMGLAGSASTESKRPVGTALGGSVVNGAIKQISDLEESVKKNPKDASAWLKLAEAYAQTGQKDKAKDAYKKAIELGDKATRSKAEAKLKKLEGRKN